MHKDNTELEALNNLAWSAIAARKDVIGGRRIEKPAVVPGPRQDAESRFSDDFAVPAHLDSALAPVAQTEVGDRRAIGWSDSVCNAS